MSLPRRHGLEGCRRDSLRSTARKVASTLREEPRASHSVSAVPGPRKAFGGPKIADVYSVTACSTTLLRASTTIVAAAGRAPAEVAVAAAVATTTRQPLPNSTGGRVKSMGSK
ncbi:hypothetical protein MMEU_2733 [Mycobacterium marinum str. Europe]|nr:hypothetical protein MMEU_2733 [Mycobacterium marinum str. Europe]